MVQGDAADRPDTATRSRCPFCDYMGPSPVLKDYGDVYVIEPIDPVTEGHVLVIPWLHVADFSESTIISETTMYWAARWCREQALEAYNLITSRGRAATQTVRHLHVHVVPRRPGDGLLLPWSEQPLHSLPE